MALAALDLTDSQTHWPISQLRENPANPRGSVSPDTVTELADSIRAQGVLQPLLITPDGVVVAGHRRLAAARLAGLTSVPVVVRDFTEQEALSAMLAENIEREDLSPMQEARAFQQLRELGLSNAQIATRTGVLVSRVTYRLPLLQLDERLQELVDMGELPIDHARHLCRVLDKEAQRKLGLLALRRHWTAARLDQIIEEELSSVARTKRPGKQPAAARFRPGSLTRKAAVEQLRSWSATKFSGLQIAETMQTACQSDCGMSDRGSLCPECPLLLFVGRLLAVKS